MDLPNADSLFVTYFSPWYPAEAEREYPLPDQIWRRLSFRMVFISMSLNPLTPEGMEAATQQVSQMYNAALVDWKQVLGVDGTPSLEWIRAFDAWCSEENIMDLLRQSDPKNAANSYVVIACEAGAMFGHCLIQAQPGLQWLYDWPYWDSAVF